MCYTRSNEFFLQLIWSGVEYTQMKWRNRHLQYALWLSIVPFLRDIVIDQVLFVVCSHFSSPYLSYVVFDNNFVSASDGLEFAIFCVCHSGIDAFERDKTSVDFLVTFSSDNRTLPSKGKRIRKRSFESSTASMLTTELCVGWCNSLNQKLWCLF